MKIIIIGGGASGCIAAITAARLGGAGLSVVILEKLSVILKKIPATGNGRCNLLNTDLDARHFHGDRELHRAVFFGYGYEQLAGFYQSLGLRLRAEEAGRVYPSSGRAESVIAALQRELDRLGVKTVTDCVVKGVTKNGNGFTLDTFAGEFSADAVIIACGGSSSPAHGSDGSAFKIAGALGADILPPVPALTPIILKEKNPNLKGVRMRGTVGIVYGGKTVDESSGELQFTDYGVSGIPALDVSGAAARLVKKGPVSARLTAECFKSASDAGEFLSEAVGKYPGETLVSLLTGAMPRKLAISKVKNAGLSPDAAAGSVPRGGLDRLSRVLYSETFTVTGVRGFGDSQVTSGGVRASCVDGGLMLRTAPGVFVCGEALNIDGVCGGFNLSFAAASGMTSGENAVKRVVSC